MKKEIITLGRFFDNIPLMKGLNIITYLIFALVVVILGKAIINQFIPPKPSLPVISQGSSMLISYMGLPLIFWFLLGLGLAIGLTFHGFKLFSINIERRDK